MATIDNIRNGLIDKILAINSKDFLNALDYLVSNNPSNEEISLTEEQIIMLEMSNEDIKNGDLISQEDVDKQDLEWLNAQ